MHTKVFEPESWMVDAACRDSDPELFFPAEGERSSKDSIRRTFEAKSVCHGCRVKMICREWAFRKKDKVAILGGTTPAERESMLQQVSA